MTDGTATQSTASDVEPGAPQFHPAQWPVLERDDDLSDLLSVAEREEFASLRLPSTAVFAFLGDTVDSFAAEQQLEPITIQDSINGPTPIWRVPTPDGDLALVRFHLGAPWATMVADFCFRTGVRTAVAVGSCGGLVPFEEGEFLVPTRALRDEGTSYKYLPASRWIDLDAALAQQIIASIDASGEFTAEPCTVWTTDAIYRETAATVAARKAEGCVVVDMECSALAACAQVRGARFGQILYTADTLAGPEGHDPRTWGRSSREIALRLALQAGGSAQA